ncbi:restriction endonuclease subunit S [Streptococcus orisratti]
MKTTNNIPAYRFQGYTDAWELRKLGDTDTIFTDGNYGEAYPKDSDLTTSSNGVPFLRGSNIQNGRLNLENVNYITISKHNELTSGHLEEDDIVIAVRGSLGSIGYVEENNIGWNINSQLAIIRTNKNEIGGRYLIQILLSNFGRKMINSLVTGTALKQLPIKNLKNIQFSLPSLPEQSAIGTFFSTLDQQITLHQRKLDTLKEQKKTYLKLLFPAKGQTQPALRFQGFEDDWEEVKFGEIVVWEKGSGLSKSDLNIEDRGGKVIHYADLYRYKEVITEIFHSSESIEGKAIPLNSLLFPMSDVTPQGLARASSISIEGVRAGGDILIANIKDNSSIFLSYQVNANYRYILPLVTGTTVRHISSTSLSTIPISLPTLPEQEAIGTFFQTLDQEIAQVEDKLASLKEMKKTLLCKLFVS